MMGLLMMGSIVDAVLGWCFGFGTSAFAEGFDFRFGADCSLGRGGGSRASARAGVSGRSE